MNAPINPVANFERDGRMNVNGNQGSRPVYMSTLSKMKLPPRLYNDEAHQQWTVRPFNSLTSESEPDY